MLCQNVLWASNNIKQQKKGALLPSGLLGRELFTNSTPKIETQKYYENWDETQYVYPYTVK